MVWAGSGGKYAFVWWIVVGIVRFMVSLLRDRMAWCRVMCTVLWPVPAVRCVHLLKLSCGVYGGGVWFWVDFWPDPAALRWCGGVGGLQSDGLFLLRVDDDDDGVSRRGGLWVHCACCVVYSSGVPMSVVVSNSPSVVVA
jgi:hypothetical protein